MLPHIFIKITSLKSFSKRNWKVVYHWNRNSVSWNMIHINVCNFKRYIEKLGNIFFNYGRCHQQRHNFTVNKCHVITRPEHSRLQNVDILCIRMLWMANDKCLTLILPESKVIGFQASLHTTAVLKHCLLTNFKLSS